MTDYIPTKRIALPVNKENAIASGIVAEKDRAQMVDTVYINLRKNSIDKTQLMILDMLANFDWKRPLYMTQVYILQDFGLMDYLQFDGYAYRFVPILTPVQNPWEIGRIDADYAAPLLKETFRYGNLADPRVYADYFIQYNLSASHARDAFARVACGRIARRKSSNCSTWGLRSCPRRRYALRTPTPIRSSKRTTPLRRWAWRMRPTRATHCCANTPGR